MGRYAGHGKKRKGSSVWGRSRRITVRAVRRDSPDARKVSQALVAFALARAEAEAQAQVRVRDMEAAAPSTLPGDDGESATSTRSEQ
jgi:hypothetical protein